jgi:O-antigen/teichoic acid export membrane protein
MLRRASPLAVVSFIGSVVAVPVSFLTARWLGPATFGRTQFVLLFYLFANLLRTGSFEGGLRAFIAHTAKGEHDAALDAQNKSVSFEIVAAALPGIAMAIAGLALGDPLRRLGFFLAPAMVVASSAKSYLSGLYSAREEFGTVARADLLRSLLGPALLVAGVPTIGASAVFLSSLAAEAITLAYLATRPGGLGLRFDLDFVAVRGFVRVGFPLGALAVVYWAYRFVGGLSVAIGLSPRSYGFYAFASGPVAAVAGLVATLHAVLVPAVWGRAAVDGDRRWIAQGERVTLLLAVLSGFALNELQAVFAPAVHVFLPRFDPSRTILDVLALNVFLLSVLAVPSLVLSSTMVNRQVRYLLIWLGALGVNSVANLVAIALGGDALAIAWNDILIQAGMVVVTFAIAAPHLRPEGRTGRLLLRVAALAALTGALSTALHLNGANSGTTGSLVVLAGARMLAVAGVWAVAGALTRGWSQAQQL